MPEINNHELYEQLNEEVTNGISKEVLSFAANVALGKIVSYKEILASLITSASTIRNTNVLTRAMYAQISAQLKIWDGYITEHGIEFKEIMSERAAVLKTFQNMLDSLLDCLPLMSEAEASNCMDLIGKVTSNMTVIAVNGPAIIPPPPI